MRTALAFFLVVTAGCHCGEDREGREARLFLERVRRIDVGQEPEQRRTEVAGLKRLVLSTERVTSARDTCVEFHESLLDAEEGAAEVRRAMDALPPGTKAGPETRRISNRLTESNESARRAGELQPECERLVAALAARHRGRR